MALPDTEAETLALFDSQARLHIEELLSQNRVLTQNQPDETIVRASVAGNRPRPYQVCINLDNELTLAQANCDCLATPPCIHIGTVWIHRLRRQLGSISGANFSRQIALRLSLSNPDAPSEDDFPTELSEPGGLSPSPLNEDLPEPLAWREQPSARRASDTQGLVNELSAILEPQRQTPQPPSTANSDERWMLGFQIELQTFPLIDAKGKNQGFKRRHIMKPCLIFLRRDGQTGRIRAYDQQLLTEPIPESDLFWLEACESQGGQLELAQVFLQCRQPNGPKAPELRGESGKPVKRLIIDSLEIKFMPHALAWGATELDFRAELLANSGETSLEIRSWEMGLGQLLCLGADGWVAEFEAEPRLSKLLDFLSARRMQLDKPAIEWLCQQLQDKPIQQLHLNFLGSDIKRCHCRGQAIIAMESSAQGMWATNRNASFLRLEIDWDFGGHSPTQDPSHDWTRLIGLDPDTNSAILWVRDLEWERRVILWLRQALRDLLAPGDRDPDLDDYPSGRHQSVDGKFHALPDPNGVNGQIRYLDDLRAFRVNCSLNDFLKSWGRPLMEEGFAIRLHRDGQVSRKGTVRIDTDNGLDWLDIEAFIETMPRGKGSPGARKRAARKAKAAALSPERREELSAIQDLLHQGIARTPTGLILLSPGDSAILERLISLGLGPGQRHRLQANDIASLSALPLAASSQLRLVERAKQLTDRLSNLEQHLLEETPAGFTAVLRGYQRRGFSWLLHMRQVGLGACLADDMGLGKTMQALALAKQVIDQNPQATKVLVIAPVSTLPNWVSECQRFIPGLRLAQHQGDQRHNANATDFLEFVAEAQLVLVSYATYRIDCQLFAQLQWDLVIADEAQQFKNPDSQIFNALVSLKATQRISLTGTPVENNVRDLWAHMEFINPGTLGALKRFQSRFAASIEERMDGQSLATLRQIISPFILRRRKQEVAPELPAKEEILIYCDLTPAQRSLYQDIKDSYLLKIEDAAKKNLQSGNAMTILEALLRLRQSCLYPSIINPDWSDMGSAKAELLADILIQLESEGHKAIVFSQFTAVLDQIEQGLRQSRWSKSWYARLDGQSPDRATPVSRFQNEPDCRLMLISTKAGGFGINLTAADYVILFDPWWNPAVENQAIDRAHRIGREKPVIVYRLIARDTVEEKMLVLQERKRELASSLTDQDENLASHLSPAELRELLG